MIGAMLSGPSAFDGLVDFIAVLTSSVVKRLVLSYNDFGYIPTQIFCFLHSYIFYFKKSYIPTFWP